MANAVRTGKNLNSQADMNWGHIQVTVIGKKKT